MAQPQQKPGSGGPPGKKGDKPTVRPSLSMRGNNVAGDKVPPPVSDGSNGVDSKPSLPEAATCSDSEWEISVELVPLDEATLADSEPNAKAQGDDLDSLVEVVLLDHPPQVKAPPPPNGVDWLNDIEAPPRPIQTIAPPQNETPDWIADLAEIEAALQAAPRPIIGTPLDWLADIQQMESLRAPIPPTTLDVASASPPQSQAAQTPIPLPAAPTPCPAPMEDNPAANTNPPLVTEDLLAKKAIAETGCDPRTGQILDQKQYEKWNALRVAVANANQPPVTTESIALVFRNARNAIERWVDDDSRRSLIVDGDLEELKKNPEVQAILAQVQNYGPIMREKLVHHLEYIVTNRRQYYTAKKGDTKGR